MMAERISDDAAKKFLAALLHEHGGRMVFRERSYTTAPWEPKFELEKVATGEYKITLIYKEEAE